MHFFDDMLDNDIDLENFIIQAIKPREALPD